jgi:Flp pilus assembly protein TadB
MPDELQELQEHAEAAAHHASLAPVTITMAILAVLVAAVSLLGHRAHTEELLHQTEATDQWAYYQAKDIRRHTYELFLDELSVFTLQSSGETEKLKEKYTKEVERYRDEQKEIEAEAKKDQDDVKHQGRRADRFDLGEVMLEAALVICSITLLTRKWFFWGMGLVLGLLGVAIAASGFFVH